ncbi:hypothetical protein [Spirillospora sp. NPDC047279]|uniref:hypothetical protein n=1 Tax=Spirillospora sp. NPDC047279 TaxID=3155478 RepID=UPI00340B666D
MVRPDREGNSVYLNADGTFDREKLASDLDQAVHGYGLWDIDEVVGWVADRLHEDPRHQDVPALLLAVYVGRFPIVYGLRDSIVLDEVTEALRFVAATLSIAECSAPGVHIHPPLKALHESEELLGGPEGLTLVIRLLDDRRAWAEEIQADAEDSDMMDELTESVFGHSSLTDFDGWHCSVFIAALAAHTLEELRLWARDRPRPLQ